MSAFHDFVKELLSGLAPVAIRRMFGGAGVYAEGVMFALIHDDALYLKTDDALKQALAAAGSAPFLWTPRKGPRAGEATEMGYWRLPESALDDAEEAVRWARRALAVSHAKKVSPPSRKSAARKR